MRNYELIYILRTDLEEEATEAVISKFTSLIEKNGGEVIKVDKWGKRRLAYPIKKCLEGFYVVVNFKAEPEVPQEVDRVLKITEAVLRHMVVVKEEK